MVMVYHVGWWRCSGESEENQRLRLCALHPARGCYPCHECAQRKGLLPRHPSSNPTSSQHHHHFLLHPGSRRVSHRGNSGEASGQGQLCPLHQRNRRTGRIPADRLHRLLSGTGTAWLQRPQTTMSAGHTYWGLCLFILQVYDPSAAYLGAPMFYAPQTYAAMPGQFRFPLAKAHIGGRGLIRPPSVRGEKCDRSASTNPSGVTVNSRLSMISLYGNHRILLQSIFFPNRIKNQKVQFKSHIWKSKSFKCLIEYWLKQWTMVFPR